jgi:signal transduction histidine kinase
VTATTFRDRAPWIVAGAAAVAFVVSIPFSFVAGANDAGDLPFIVPAVPAVGLYLWIGATIATRARNPIGWIFLSVAGFFSFGSLLAYYAEFALVRHHGSLPFGVAAAWVDKWTMVAMLAPFVLVFLLFPTGDTPTRRWRWLLWALLALIGVEVVVFAVSPGPLTGGMADLASAHVTNPLGLPVSRRAVDLVTQVIGMLILAGGFLSVVALIVRYRRAAADERQQIRWLAYVGIATAVTMVLTIVTGSNENAPTALLFLTNVFFFATFVLLVLGIPIASGIAILQYRLYDLDVVVRKTLVATVLLVLIGGGSAAILLTVGQVALWRGTARGVSVVIGIAIGLLFGPLLRLARRIADRIVYGRRATPYEVLTDFSERMAETYSTEDILPRMAAIVGRGTGAASAAILLDVGGERREVARWTAGDADPSAGDVHGFEVRHQGEILGAVTVSMPANDPMNPSKDKLVRGLASQAGLVLRNVRLIEELRASRQRLVAAQDEERRKLERNLHDGAQQHLVALAVQLRLAEQLAGRDADKEREILHRLQSMTTEALEELRDLARGIYPPLLADKGLAAALEAHARRSPVAVTIDADGVGRYPQAVESALYFCSLEALNNVAKYAEATIVTIRLRRDDGLLRVDVTDDGVGFDAAAGREGTGIRGMADRLDAIGGRLDVRSTPGRGTVVSAAVPVAAPVAAEDAP